MPIESLEVSGFRSLRRVHLELVPLTVIVGPNGSGKTNLYRAMYLLHAAAIGQLSRAIADEGGIPSVMWAGRRERSATARIRIELKVDDFEYALDLGPVPTSPADVTAFKLDPEVNEERLWILERRQRHLVMERKQQSAFLRDADGNRVSFPAQLWGGESILSQLAEPHRFPLLSAVQQLFRSWRFYHHFRTDPDAPLRSPQVGIRTPVLAHDGRDLAAALQTIIEIGDDRGLQRAIDDAFPGSRLSVESVDGRFRVLVEQPGMLRPLGANELSDGTLRYLCLLAALLSPRPPPFLALNEPETSLHPDLLLPLARLITETNRTTQIWVTTHAEPLARALAQTARVEPLRLEKTNGETQVVAPRG